MAGHLVVVQQGELALYARLSGELAPEGVTVIWDRRTGERRTIVVSACPWPSAR